MRGRHSVVEDYGKASIDESEISIHSSPTSRYIYFKWKSFVCVHRKDFNPVGHPAVCSVHFMAQCFTQAFYEKGTRKYLKSGSTSAIRKEKHQISYLSRIVEWWVNIYLPLVLTSHVR